MATTTKTLKLTFLNGEKKKNSITLGMLLIILLKIKFVLQ